MLSQIGRAFGNTPICFVRLIAKNKFFIFCTVCNVFLTYKYFDQIKDYKQQIAELKRTQYEWNVMHEGRYQSAISALVQILQYMGSPAFIQDSAYYNGDRNHMGEPREP